MELTIRTKGAIEREWAIGFCIRGDGEKDFYRFNFINTVTGEVIEGIKYDNVRHEYEWLPPFNPPALIVYSDGVPMNITLSEFIKNVASLKDIEDIIKIGVLDDELKKSWNIESPHIFHYDENIKIAINISACQNVIELGRDCIITAIKLEKFNYKALSPKQFIQVCSYWYMQNLDNVPF